MLIETPGGFDYTAADCMEWMRTAGFTSTHAEHLVGPDSMVIANQVGERTSEEAGLQSRAHAFRLMASVRRADEKAATAVGFLRRSRAFYRRHGIEIQELLTDNGGAYISLAHAVACRALGIRHIRTRPYRPQTNGKAEPLHPHHARRLGLRCDLPQLSRAHRSP